MSLPPLRGTLPGVWEQLVRCKAGYYTSSAHYYLALALLQLSSLAGTEQTNSRLIHVLINGHSRVAAAAERTLRRPVYADSAIESAYGRVLLGNYYTILLTFSGARRSSAFGRMCRSVCVSYRWSTGSKLSKACYTFISLPVDLLCVALARTSCEYRS